MKAPKNWWVVLDASSAAGSIFKNIAPRSLAAGEKIHPALLCSELDRSNPIYLAVTYLDKPSQRERDLQPKALMVPHQAVIAIFEGEQDEVLPIGFRSE